MKVKLIITALFIAGVTKAQDIVGILPMNNLLSINPSFAGTNGGLRVQGNHLNIWPSLSGSWLYHTLNIDMSINSGKSGLALYANNENINKGGYVTNDLGLGYAHHFSVLNGNIKIIPSAQLGIINCKSVPFIDCYTPPIPQPSNISKFEINTGVIVQLKKKLTAGVSVFHANRPDLGANAGGRLSARTVFHASYNIISEKNYLINLFGGYKYQYGVSSAAAACSVIFKKHIYVTVTGGYARFSQDGSFGLGWRSDIWSILISAYKPLGGEFQNSAGSYQIGGSFNMRGKANIHRLCALENW